MNLNPEASPNSLTLRREIEEFLPQIRFLTLTTDEFVEIVLPCNFFTTDESMAILMKIKDVPGSDLPSIAPCELRERRWVPLAAFLPEFKVEESEAPKKDCRHRANRASVSVKPKSNKVVWKH